MTPNPSTMTPEQMIKTGQLQQLFGMMGQLKEMKVRILCLDAEKGIDPPFAAAFLPVLRDLTILFESIATPPPPPAPSILTTEEGKQPS